MLRMVPLPIRFADGEDERLYAAATRSVTGSRA
jgi:hypothetical protein